MTKSLNVESMLRSAFLMEELEFLKTRPRFAESSALVKTPEQFERLCNLGEELLAAYHRSNSSAQQFRSSRHSVNA
jgi:hypothetical protein